jgi:hypothetical protein
MVQDITVYLSIIMFCIILGVVGLWTRIYFLMIIGGVIMTFLAVIPMDFVDGSRIETLDTTTDIIVPTYEDDPVQVDIYPKILLGIVGSMFMIGGALAWRTDRD